MIYCQTSLVFIWAFGKKLDFESGGPKALVIQQVVLYLKNYNLKKCQNQIYCLAIPKDEYYSVFILLTKVETLGSQFLTKQACF